MKYYDSGSGTYKDVPVGGGAEEVTISASQPASNTDLWVDTSLTPVTLKYYNGSSYQLAGGADEVTISTGPPQVTTDLWVDTDDDSGGAAPTMTPTGVIQQFAGTTPPSGYLICDGSAVSRTTYAALYAVCGVIYGIGDGSTTFNLPNLTGRVPLGVEAASGNNIGVAGGAATVTLTTAQMPTHMHDVAFYPGGGVMGQEPGSSYVGYWGVSVAPSNYLRKGVASDAGGGQAHNNMQPYLAINYIIKT